MKTLDELVQRQQARRAALQQALASILEQLKGLGARKVILFGSFARDQVGPRTDLDLLAVMPSDRTSRQWMEIIYSSVRRPVACDILAYNEEELGEISAASRFVRRIFQEGKVVYEAASPSGSPTVVDSRPRMSFTTRTSSGSAAGSIAPCFIFSRPPKKR